MITDQTSVFLTALAQAAHVMRLPTCIRVIGGNGVPAFSITSTDADARIAQVLARFEA